jgi:hypothetical protein
MGSAWRATAASSLLGYSCDDGAVLEEGMTEMPALFPNGTRLEMVLIPFENEIFSIDQANTENLVYSSLDVALEHGTVRMDGANPSQDHENRNQ